MISINFTLFVQILNFLVLVWVFNRIFIRPIMRNMEAKEQALADRQGAVELLRDETADRETAYQEKLKSVRSVAMAKREELQSQAAAEAKRLRGEAAKEAAGVMARVRSEIESSVEVTRKALKEKEEVLAGQLTEAVLGRKA